MTTSSIPEDFVAGVTRVSYTVDNGSTWYTGTFVGHDKEYDLGHVQPDNAPPGSDNLAFPSPFFGDVEGAMVKKLSPLDFGYQAPPPSYSAAAASGNLKRSAGESSATVAAFAHRPTALTARPTAASSASDHTAAGPIAVHAAVPAARRTANYFQQLAGIKSTKAKPTAVVDLCNESDSESSVEVSSQVTRKAPPQPVTGTVRKAPPQMGTDRKDPPQLVTGTMEPHRKIVTSPLRIETGYSSKSAPSRKSSHLSKRDPAVRTIRSMQRLAGIPVGSATRKVVAKATKSLKKEESENLDSSSESSISVGSTLRRRGGRSRKKDKTKATSKSNIDIDDLEEEELALMFYSDSDEEWNCSDSDEESNSDEGSNEALDDQDRDGNTTTGNRLSATISIPYKRQVVPASSPLTVQRPHRLATQMRAILSVTSFDFDNRGLSTTEEQLLSTLLTRFHQPSPHLTALLQLLIVECRLCSNNPSPKALFKRSVDFGHAIDDFARICYECKGQAGVFIPPKTEREILLSLISRNTMKEDLEAFVKASGINKGRGNRQIVRVNMGQLPTSFTLLLQLLNWQPARDAKDPTDQDGSAINPLNPCIQWAKSGRLKQMLPDSEIITEIQEAALTRLSSVVDRLVFTPDKKVDLKKYRKDSLEWAKQELFDPAGITQEEYDELVLVIIQLDAALIQLLHEDEDEKPAIFLFSSGKHPGELIQKYGKHFSPWLGLLVSNGAVHPQAEMIARQFGGTRVSLENRYSSDDAVTEAFMTVFSSTQLENCLRPLEQSLHAYTIMRNLPPFTNVERSTYAEWIESARGQDLKKGIPGGQGGQDLKMLKVVIRKRKEDQPLAADELALLKKFDKFRDGYNKYLDTVLVAVRKREKGQRLRADELVKVEKYDKFRDGQKKHLKAVQVAVQKKKKGQPMTEKEEKLTSDWESFKDHGKKIKAAAEKRRNNEPLSAQDQDALAKIDKAGKAAGDASSARAKAKYSKKSVCAMPKYKDDFVSESPDPKKPLAAHQLWCIHCRKPAAFKVQTTLQTNLTKLDDHKKTNLHKKRKKENRLQRPFNLASNDVERFLMAALFVNYLFWAPLQSCAILVVGCWQLGPAFAAGFALLIGVFIPLQLWLGGSFAFYRSKIAGMTDKRVNFVSQAIRGARVMKVSGYEHRFLDRIMGYRNDEVAQIAKANRLKSYNEALFFSTNVVISLVIFIVHVSSGRELNEGAVFTVFTLINILQLEMTKHVSLAVMATSECWVSIGRIQQFLEFPELSSNNAKDQHVTADDSRDDDNAAAEVAIALRNVKCYWNEVEQSNKQSQCSVATDDNLSDTSSTSSRPALFLALQDVTVDFSMGELTAVIGTVGSGKSALLQALVKELPVSSGKIKRRYKTLAYASQDPWIMDGTVKENILMGVELNEDWYDQVVTACGLLLDFEQLGHGDQTILGDRGVQCSGGQRARIGLARAIYRDTDVLVADDPLSAVDAKVGRQLYQDAIQGLVVGRGKCVVLATHQHQYVNDCRCVLVTDGRVECVGSYPECVAASQGKLTAHAADDAIDGLDAVEELDGENSRGGGNSAVNEAVAAEEDPDALLNPDNHGESDYREMNQEGNVEWDTYANYLRAMGGIWIGGFLFLLFSATQGSVLVTFAQVGRWAEMPAEEQDDWDILGLVIGLGCVVIFLAFARVLICFHLTIKASQRLHDRMANAVLRAKVQFFDTNPMGRILNRFSADVGITDDLLPPTLYDFFMLAFIVLGAVATTISTLPFVLVAIPFLMWYFLYVRNVFVTSSRELKRLEGLARSPIFAMLSESLGGIATIRSNDALQFFRSQFEQVHDTHTRCFFSFIAASRWVGFRMDSLVFFLLAAVSFFSVLFNEQGWFPVDPAILGLSLSMLLQLTGLFQWCIRQSAEVVNQMVSVERVLAFGKIEPEAPLEMEGDRALLETGWPQQGAIEVDQVSVRYRQSLPLALQQISFTIPQGARVGIVGRTGSGKSTIVQTLFRLLEAEHGRIVVDGVDIAKLGLHAVRTNISVIPQVPTLFSGCSIRENLDLFGLHTNAAIEKVLRDCHLQQMIDDLPQGLDSPVSEGGSNFSVGQRQLLCLARAILSQNKILVLDEFSANIDRRTDQLLQEALQESFREGTILAVAHRLDTIIEFDYCLVLGGGKVLEYGSPAELIRRENGAFASMVNDTGEAMSNELRQRAFQKEVASKKTRRFASFLQYKV